MIESPLLKQFCGYVAGQWVKARDGKTMPVINPATGQHLGDVPKMGARETTEAVDAAAKALASVPSIHMRQTWLKAVGNAMLENKQELGRIITLEHGKPLKEGIAEVEYSAGFFFFFADQLHHLADEPLGDNVRGCRWTLYHRPAGVAGLIAPWNFPLAMLAKKMAAALGAGCPMVVKPASLTPLTAIATTTIFIQVGVDPSMTHLVMGDARQIGNVLCTHPAVRIISFTGSTEVGCKLTSATADHVKRLTMELGGNAPFIVFDDADIDAAVDALMANKFRAGGQTCVCTNRVYLHANIANKFLENLVPKVKALKMGNGMETQTDIGPLVNRDAFDKVACHVVDALKKGAKRLVGNDPARPSHDYSAFYPPTLLTDAAPNMLVFQEETFGPVLAVATFTDNDKVITDANSTEYGLAAFVFTADTKRAQTIVAQLNFGHVGLNTGTGPSPHAPFGGMKQSGFGREGGVAGLLEFTEPQVVATA